MVSANQTSNGLRPNISSTIPNTLQMKQVASALALAVGTVAIVSAISIAGIILSDDRIETVIEEGFECHDLKYKSIMENPDKCEIQHSMKPPFKQFPTSNVYQHPNPPYSCDEVKKMPLGLTALKNVLNTDFNYPPSYTYSYYPYSASTPTTDKYAATNVLVNNCHGCICLKLIPTFIIQCKKPPVRRHAIILPRSVQPTCDVYEGDTVNVVVSKTGTDPSSVDIDIYDQEAKADHDFQNIALSNLNFTDFGDQVMSFTIDTVDDNVIEGVETFEVQLSNPSSGTIEYPILTITIIDND